MVYLSSQGIVHRDLALRNLLANPSNVTGIKYVVKVADFGYVHFMVTKYLLN